VMPIMIMINLYLCLEIPFKNKQIKPNKLIKSG
jgi:hypothetical protein